MTDVHLIGSLLRIQFCASAIIMCSVGRELKADSPTETKSPQVIARLEHPKPPVAVAFLAERDQIISACADDHLRIWSVTSGKETWSAKLEDLPHAIASDKGGKIIFLSTRESIEAWDVAAGKRLWRLKSEGEPGFRPSFDDIAVAPDNKSIAVARSNADIVFLDPRDEKVIRTIKHRNFDARDPVAITSCSFSPDGKRLLAVSEEGVDIWDVKKGVIVGGFGHPHFKVSCAAYSPNEKQVIVGCEDNTVRVWEFGVGPWTHKFVGHTKPPLIIRFLDKDNILTAGLDGLIIHWNIPQKQIIRKFVCTEKQVLDLAVSEDRKRIAAACETGEVVVYDLEKRQ